MTEQVPSHDRDACRRRLYEVMADESLDYGSKRQQALEIGRDFLGVQNGHVERVSGDGTHEVVATAPPGSDSFPVGRTLEAATTYCRRTLETDSHLAVSNAPEEGWADDPAYREHGLGCYLGAPITVDGDQYGTVCFVDEDPRGGEFTPAERSFVELLATLLGREEEARRHGAALEDREAELAERERALERSEAKYESLLAAAPDAILLVDAEGGTIVEANEAATDLTGRDRADLVGAAVTTVHPDEYAERYREAFADLADGAGPTEALADGTPLVVERPDGGRVPVEISASRVELEGETYVQGILRDVSDRREREEDLRVMRRALDEAAVGVTIADADTPDNDIVYANDEFAAITGRDRDAILGRNCRMLQGPGTDPDAVARLREGVEAERPVATELLNYRADGTPFWNEVTITPVTDGDGETTHFVGFQRDVTERVRRERLITVLNRVLRHNLRNGVGVITGLAGEIAAEGDGRVAAIADRIAARGWDLAALSDQASVLDAVVHEETSPHPVDVVPVVADAVDDLATEYPDATVRTDLPDEQRALATARLPRAVSELVENALEHAGEAPTVEVRVEAGADGGAVVEIEDDGPGLPDNERAVLRMGRETKLAHGSGLGLWLVNWIVTDAGGCVETAVDDGTTVRLQLRPPRDEAAVARSFYGSSADRQD